MSLFFTVDGWILSGQTNIWDVGWETKYEIWISGRREEGVQTEEEKKAKGYSGYTIIPTASVHY